MLITNLRKVGGSVMLAVPPAILESLDMESGSAVSLSVDAGSLVVRPVKCRHTLDELLAQCDAGASMSDEDKEWINGKPMGAELI